MENKNREKEVPAELSADIFVEAKYTYPSLSPVSPVVKSPFHTRDTQG